MKDLRARLDDILIAAETRTEENPEGDWSSSRSFLLMSLVVFWCLSLTDEAFRDPAAHVTVILALIAGAYAGKIVDLRMAIGQAAAAIGRRIVKRKEETTIEEPDVDVGEVHVDADEVTVEEKPKPGVDPPPMGML